jgi:CheY-like chemotaxis protein
VVESDTGAKDQAVKRASTETAYAEKDTVHAPVKFEAEPNSRRLTSPEDLAGALHEVSNALTVVLGWIDRARTELEGACAADDALAIAASRARHARHIVRRAIGADVPEDEPTGIAAILTEAAVGLDPEARRASVTLRTAYDPSLDGAHLVGASIILQILTNLLLNAIAVSPPHGVVLLDVAVDGSDVVFGVTDEGPGIPVERRKNLLDAGISTRVGGAGIGLKYAATLAREAGGALSLARAEPGARFELRWPRRRSSLPAAPVENRKPPSVLAGRRVLVIEDDAAVLDLLDVALESRGAVVVRATSQAELARVLTEGPVDAALVDLSPISDDILGALAAVRATNDAVRLIVMSGSPSSIPSLPAAWNVASVRKPFEIGEIVTALTR